MTPFARITGKVSDARHMQYIISTPRFEDRYKGDTTIIDLIIDDVNRRAFDEWLNNGRTIEYLTIRELKQLASVKRVTNYSRMDKHSLIKEIKARG